jgi:sporulation protein YlmC with PRC-barrel domain
MLIPYERLLKTPVMSLQTGAELAVTARMLVDPRDLTIVAYELEGHNLDQRPSFLRPTDVRELSNLGLIVDSSEEFVALDDVIRIKQVYGYDFNLVGLEVLDDRKKKLGKVQGYNVDSGSFSVQQLVVRRPLLKSFGDTELLIHRSQIVEVRDSYVKVRSTSAEEPARNVVREYTNPFRTGSVQPEAIDADTQWPYA